jgi:hypothetical protein
MGNGGREEVSLAAMKDVRIARKTNGQRCGMVAVSVKDAL